MLLEKVAPSKLTGTTHDIGESMSIIDLININEYPVPSGNLIEKLDPMPAAPIRWNPDSWRLRRAVARPPGRHFYGSPSINTRKVA